ncbi:CPBP family intramembrane glutamic endopeptidase [Clostridium lacusfryxellense]|uniref:CPBP family intramembrane glutamic endopeptidase n=1 Tax=Clostridium lacusfryxellense TaxID=205328 RepID=UPI001C0E6AE5|nr:CPBP family intramembrane glutamic endopeptidase [Clostridium lacusfryxellense]MBU3110232.1 CPBP family intramembrane metalloprotease [Clostridium lacusfryxellense]
MDLGFILKGTIMQFIVFSFSPFIWWLIKHRKQTTFFKWIGLFKPKKIVSNKGVIFAIAGYMIILLITHIPTITKYTQPSANKYSGLTFEAVIPILIVCFIQNGVCEEVLFRGFLGKRFIAIFGVKVGNVSQAICFGIAHVLFFSGDIMITYILLMITTSVGGWMLGYFNEKIFNGSIIPSILLHGLGNFLMNMSKFF